MKFVTILLVFLIRIVNNNVLGGHEARFYFNLLKADSQSVEETLLPQMSRRRPSPSDQLPIVDLLEDEGDSRNPLPSDIDVLYLRQQLGKSFDHEYMSVQDPRSKADNPLIQFINGRPKGRRPSYLSLLRTTTLQDGTKIKLNVTKNNRRKFQKYVWSLTFCPVKYSWKFLGIRVWPQWIKEGTCFSQRSCSIPPGMTCKQSAYTYKPFLRWHCADFQRRHFCRWISFLYPIITECSCAC